MKSAANACRFRAARGHSLAEMLVVTGVAGSLAGGLLSMVADDRRRLADRNLSKHSGQLNRAVDVYRASGGRLDGLVSFEAAFSRMKSVASPATADAVVGLRGSMIDPALTYEMQSDEEAESESPRVRWDSASGEFILTSTGAAGAKRFYVDAAAVPEEREQDGRSTALAYALESNWVWDYEDLGVPGRGTREAVMASGGISEVGPTTPSSKLVLDPPTHSPAGGTFAWGDFPLPVVLTDPNPTGVSMLVFSTDGTTWSTGESGTVVPVGPNDRLVAYSASIDPDSWLDSFIGAEDYVRDAAVVSGEASTVLLEGSVAIAGFPLAPLGPVGGDSDTAPAPFSRTEAAAAFSFAAGGSVDLAVAGGSSTVTSDVDHGSGPRTARALMVATDVDLQLGAATTVSVGAVQVEVTASGGYATLTSSSTVEVDDLEVSVGGVVVGSFTGTVTDSDITLVDVPGLTVVANRTSTGGDGVSHVSRDCQALTIDFNGVGLATVELELASASAALTAASGSSD